MTGKLNRRLIIEKYAKQIGQMFGRQGNYRQQQPQHGVAEHHQQFPHYLPQIVEEEDRYRERSTVENERGKGQTPRKNITVVKVDKSSLASDHDEDQNAENVDDREADGDNHDNVKSVRFQSNVVQIQSYEGQGQCSEGEEKRTRN